MLSHKFNSQHNKEILSLQYFTLARDQNKNAEDWMFYLRIQVNEFDCKEKDRRLKEQFINGINNDNIMTELIRELTAIKIQ